jgi:3-hydroxyisobutyrate dehydrogenase-like beta-hydroxyacid dehydrogenase
MVDRFGFIGVGTMGSAIASRLVGSTTLLVNDLNPRAAEDLIDAGATFATLDEIASSCQYVFLCLPAPKNVTDLLFDKSALADRLTAGTVVIDMTSSTPAVDDEIVRRLTANEIRFADSPIAGGVRRARAGDATLMVGAVDDDFDTIKHLLLTVTPNVYHVGAVGTGHAMKLVNNLLNACHRFAALQCVRLAVKDGIDEAMAIAVLNSGSGRSYVTEYTFPELMRKNQLQGFTIELMRKDVRLANELAVSLGHDVEIGRLVEKYMDEAVGRFGPQADQTEMMLAWYPDKS